MAAIVGGSRRIRVRVDRRFNRPHYDARQTAESFVTRLRSEWPRAGRNRTARGGRGHDPAKHRLPLAAVVDLGLLHPSIAELAPHARRADTSQVGRRRRKKDSLKTAKVRVRQRGRKRARAVILCSRTNPCATPGARSLACGLRWSAQDRLTNLRYRLTSERSTAVLRRRGADSACLETPMAMRSGSAGHELGRAGDSAAALSRCSVVSMPCRRAPTRSRAPAIHHKT
jgi:hypothetical protein